MTFAVSNRALALPVMVAAMLAGCLTPQDYTPLQQFTIEPNLTDLPATNATSATLGIRRFSAALPLKRDIFYRDPGLRVGTLLDAQWAENPADMITRFMFDATLASGRFEDVGLATDVSRPTFVLTGDVRRFDLDRTRDVWHAECQVHIELRAVTDGTAAWSDTLSASIPLENNEIVALPAAMSEATADVIRSAMAGIIQAGPQD